MADSIIASLPARVHNLRKQAVNNATIYWRTRKGTPVVFLNGADVCTWMGKWHMIDLNNCLVPLDRKKDGRFFLKGHGRD